jgi:hypothetical protein
MLIKKGDFAKGFVPLAFVLFVEGAFTRPTGANKLASQRLRMRL